MRRLKQIVSILACCFFVCMTFACVINSVVIDYSSEYIYHIDDFDKTDLDTVIVLGAKVYKSGNLSPILADRMSYGINLYRRNAAKSMLLTGDHGNDNYDEVNSMKNYALEREVSLENIYLDHAGFSTYDSMIRADRIFEVESAVIVTQKFHIYRAVYIARKQGIEAYGVNSDPRRYIGAEFNDAREFIARTKDWIFVNILRPEPHHLGDPMPINSDSSLTHD